MHDALIHLMGDQIAPNLLALRQFPATHNILIATEHTKNSAYRLQKIDSSVEVRILKSAYRIEDMRTLLEDICSRQVKGDSLLFNITGGTKLMSVGMILFALQKRMPYVYINTFEREVLYFAKEGKTLPLKASLTIRDFMQMAGHNIQNEGQWTQKHEERTDLTRKVWENRSHLLRIQEAISAADRKGTSYRIEKANFLINISDKKSTATVGGVSHRFKSSAEACKYFSGGWLEEYGYLVLRPLLDSGRLSDIRIGLMPCYRKSPESNPSTFGIQEFDIVTTDGFDLTIIECKAGTVVQDHIQKIENLAAHYGGTMGHGVLFAAKLTKRMRERLKTTRITTFEGAAIPSASNQFFKMKPGRIYADAT